MLDDDALVDKIVWDVLVVEVGWEVLVVKVGWEVLVVKLGQEILVTEVVEKFSIINTKLATLNNTREEIIRVVQD